MAIAIMVHTGEVSPHDTDDFPRLLEDRQYGLCRILGFSPTEKYQLEKARMSPSKPAIQLKADN